MRRIVFAALLPFMSIACGDDSANPGGADASPDGCHAVCGDGVLQCNEQCDDGNNRDGDGCSHDCKIECGDGVLQADEKCDTAIPVGTPGACPTSCDDQNACTTDSINGSACQQECAHGDITACQAGDGCCPSACNSGNDSDCSATCGNGVVETGETCDTGIAAGMPGACPTSCNDNQACTTDVLMNQGTCTAACMHTNITTCTNGDGCCPSGCTHANDNDCAATCGNGTVDPGETCDIAITTGAGKCPTAASCNDNNACTTDSLLSGGTCMAACNNVPITACTNSDGCCAAGCNANNDNDCQPRCGNGVIEPGEQCDDGNTTNGDGCSSTCQYESRAFRVTSAFIRDPHVFVNIGLCIDGTDMSGIAGTNSANSKLNASISGDTNPMDGKYDLSIVAIFNPLVQSQMTNPIELMTQADCNVASASNPTVCHPHAGATIVNGTATNHSTGTCLGIIPGTVHPYNPPVGVPGAPCFDSDTHDVTFPVAGAMITLHGARAAATYQGVPATQLNNGEIRGFLTEADANSTTIMVGTLYNGPLAGLLPGGNGNCQNYSDKDMGPDANGNMVSGWWFYINFQAAQVPFVTP